MTDSTGLGERDQTPTGRQPAIRKQLETTCTVQGNALLLALQGSAGGREAILASTELK